MKRLFFAPGLGLVLAALAVSPLAHAQDNLTNGLVAFYQFKGDTRDTSGNGNDGVIVGSDWVFSLDRFGQSNSLYLNTTSPPSQYLDCTYVTAPRSAALDFNQDFTMSAWVKVPPGLGGYYVHNPISNGPDQQIGAYSNGVNLRIISDVGGYDYFQYVCNHTTGDIHAFVEPLRQTWWQAVVVRSGATLSLYRNGSPLTNSPYTATVTNWPAIWLGRHLCPGYPAGCPSSYPLVGGLDDVRLYNRALSAAEVRQLYQYEVNPLPYLTVAVKTLRLSLFAEAGTSNQLEAATSLGSWTPYGPPFLATNSLTFVDVDILGTDQQFFRVRRIIP
jgi:hypothetical protein